MKPAGWGLPGGGARAYPREFLEKAGAPLSVFTDDLKKITESAEVKSFSAFMKIYRDSDEDREFLMVFNHAKEIRQASDPEFEYPLWETPLFTSLRELFEETGLVVATGDVELDMRLQKDLRSLYQELARKERFHALAARSYLEKLAWYTVVVENATVEKKAGLEIERVVDMKKTHHPVFIFSAPAFILMDSGDDATSRFDLACNVSDTHWYGFNQLAEYAEALRDGEKRPMGLNFYKSHLIRLGFDPYPPKNE